MDELWIGMKLVAEVVPVVGKIICSHLLKFSTLAHILAAICNPGTLKVMLFRSIDRQTKIIRKSKRQGEGAKVIEVYGRSETETNLGRQRK